MNGLVALAFASSFFFTAQQDACRTPDSRQAAKAKPATIAELLDNPKTFVDVPVRVRGRLVNAGGNYFSRTRRIVLRDANGRELAVEPWLPLSAPTTQAGGSSRPTLAEYLDKNVELSGTIQSKTVEGSGVQHFLRVAEASVLPDA
ncbi:MAG: hypothetical protein ACRD1S_10140 [Vicinamibacterales bacterium]